MPRDDAAKLLFSLTNISKTYVAKERPVLVIPSLKIPRGEIIALIGYSGSGKTTLLNILAMLETPDQGIEPDKPQRSLSFSANPDGEPEDVINISAQRRQELRSTFGFIFQQGYLLENLTCSENIKVPFYARQLDPDSSGAIGLLRAIGLQDAMSHRPPSELSGGERQRISVLRALAHGPSVVFADEPTSNLDEENALVVLSGLRSWHRAESSRTILLVTHNIGHAARYADSVILMAPGRVHGPIPIVSGTGLRVTANELSAKLAEYSEGHQSPGAGSAPGGLRGLDIPLSRPAARPFADLCQFVLSFAFADVFPRVSREVRKGLFQRVFKRRNAQFHSMVSMFFALLLALFFSSLYSTMMVQFTDLVADRSIAKIEVLGRQDGERLLSQKDVDDLSHLSSVDAAVGYRIREMRLLRKPTSAGFSFNTDVNLPVVSSRFSDPVLRKIFLLTGNEIAQMIPGTRSLGSVFDSSPDSRAGIVCTKTALLQLGFSGSPPKTIGLHTPYSSDATPEAFPLVGVVEWLPKSAEVLITDDLFDRFFHQGGSGDPLPRFESVDLYFGDMMKDGVGIYEALQRLGYSVSGDKLLFLRWVKALMSAVRYFSLVAGMGIFLVVFITLMVSYSEAIRRKEKEIGVLLAYGTPMGVLYWIFFTEVGFVWAVATLMAIPAQWVIARAVSGLVAEGFKLQGAQSVASSLPLGLWLLTLGGSLAVAIISVTVTMRKIDPMRVAQTLRSPD